MSERNILSRSPIPSYIPQEEEIHHVVYEDGGEAYHNSPCGPNNYSYELNVVSTELEVLVGNWICQLRSMVRLLEDKHYIAFGQNFETLLHAFDRNMDEALHAVYENIGWIRIHEVVSNVSGWRVGRVVGVELELADQRKIDREG